MVAEARALHADLPILIAQTSDDQTALPAFEADPCLGQVAKPYNAARLAAALQPLGVRCQSS